MRFPEPFQRGALAAALLLALPVAHAQEATDLDEVVVTATRTALTANDQLAAVEVISRAQIERSAARSLPELLRGRAGASLVNQGGLGKLSTLFLRGTESDHVVFLVDGVRVGSPSSGLTSLQDLPLAQIERIEIVRGPRSSLYGADAIGGVIQLFTRRGAADAGVRGRGRMAAGSHGLREASAGMDLRGQRGGVGIELAHQRTDGINACRGDYDPATWTGAGCFIVPGTQLDRDGYRNASASLRADFAPSEAWQLEARAMHADGHNAYDGDYVDSSDIVQRVVGASVRWTPTASLQFKLAAGRNSDLSDNHLLGSYANGFDTFRDSASLQADATLAQGHVLTAGIDWLRDSADIDDPWGAYAARRGNRAGFAQYQGRLGAHDVQLSLRRDHNDQFGSATTGGIAWGVDLGGAWRLSASHGSAFKAPTFNELYYPYYGNPTLRPERSRSSEVSLGQRHARWEWQANGYVTRVRDLIAHDAALNLPNNLQSAAIRGLEVTGALEAGAWQVRGQLGLLDARNRDAGSDARLPRRPTRSARLDVDRDFGAWSAGVSAIAESARWDDVANTLRVGGYATLDGSLRWRLAPAWTLQANLVNAFDKRYETTAFYLQPGREVVLALSWSGSP